MKHRVDSGRVAWGFGRRWWMILLLTLLVAGAGYAAASMMKPVYRATGSILVGRPFSAANPSKEYIEASQQLAQAYADIAARQPVLESVVDDLGLSVNWTELRDRVNIEVPANNPGLIVVEAESGSREAAAQILDQLLDRILKLRPAESRVEDQETQDFVRGRLETLQEDIRERQRRIDELERALITASPEESVDLQAQIDANQELVVQWQVNYSDLLNFRGEETSPNDLQILETSGTQASLVRPDVPLYTALAGGVGFFLGLALAYALEFRRREAVSRSFGSAAPTPAPEPSDSAPQSPAPPPSPDLDATRPDERRAIALDDPGGSPIRTAGNAGSRPQK